MASKTKTDVVPVEDLSIKALNRLAGIDRNVVPESVEDIDKFFGEQGGVVEFEGSQWDIVEKEKLVGVPFTIVDCHFYTGKFGDAVAVTALLDSPLSTVGHDGRHIVFNDGSTGVLQQVEQAVRRAGRRGGFYCPKGLRASEYTWFERDFDDNPIGEPHLAKTYYVA